MPEKQQPDSEYPFGTPRKARVAAFAYAASAVFGVILIATGDWVPGTVIVLAAVAGFAALIAVLRRIRTPKRRPSARSRPTG